MNNALASYQQTQVETVGQGEIVVLLYDGAIRFLMQAKERIAKKDFGGKGIAISRALDIVSELDASLNMEKGGEIAKNLHSLYLFASTALLKANMKLDVDLIDHVIHMLSELKYSFEIIIQTAEAKAVGEEIRASRANSAYVARNVTEAPSAGRGQSAANSAYQNVARQAGVQTNTAQVASTEVQAPSPAPSKEIDTASVANFLAQNENDKRGLGAKTAPVAQAPAMEFATIEAPASAITTPQENVGGFDLQAGLFNLRQKSAEKLLAGAPEGAATSPKVTAPPPTGLKSSLSSSLTNG